MADLVAMLPASSRTHAALTPDSAPVDPAVALVAIERDVRCVLWALGCIKSDEPPQPLTVGASRYVEVDEQAMDDVARAIGITLD